jgi:hypothetical protein
VKTITLHASTIEALRERVLAGRRFSSEARPVAGGLFEIEVDDDVAYALELLDPDPEAAIVRALSGQMGTA